ncbi:transmembrane amino acid transporter protein-domain-containing protein [Stachybotrys elegans]|uniref:Transmembrane amino acid transporter protein-domain-containing protein n=1 Tax=Stachybotrys elegans TaxID=80388 RepID=A0A8K0SCJ1_9HYPO|nr:transmembrane amino acid transporter protein-domain-containing protein [Stachybotrys elegans]
MAPEARIPTTWDEYEGRRLSSGSVSSNAVAEDQSLLGEDDDDDANNGFPGIRRRGSVTHRLAAVADIGGVNSIRSFARSWQRAAGFPEVIPRRPSFVFAPDQQEQHPAGSSEDIQYGRGPAESPAQRPQGSLLRQHLEASFSAGEPSARPDAGSSDFRDRESKALDAELGSTVSLMGGTPSSRASLFAAPALSSPPVIGSYGSYRSSAYGTMGRGTLRVRHMSSTDQLADRWADQGEEASEDSEDDDAALGEHQPILVKEVKQGNKVILTVEGQSTLPQSIFNSINALIGVGMLSLPLAFKMSGWIFGLLLLTVNAAVTGYTGKILARCMDYDPSLITYSDIAYVSFGSRARIIVSALFSIELVAACVALVILFSDSLYLLLPGLFSVETWKCICGVLVLVLNTMPLRWLSYTSVIGIFSTFSIVCIVILDGLVKEHKPGSLWEPATTYLLPSNWLALPLAYGLLASPWGAHSVFPSIYRDMRHPYKWGRAVKVTFSFSYVLDTCLAIVGILMFGDDISDAITSNILRTAGYPDILTVLMCLSVAIIPLTKIPLNFRPIITTIDVLCGVHQDHHGHHGHHHHSHAEAAGSQRSAVVASALRVLIRVSSVLVLLVISILFPAFDSICAFLGAALCTLISVVLPLSFYLKLYWNEIPVTERLCCWVVIIVFSVLGAVGTVWTFLPKELIGV